MNLAQLISDLQTKWQQEPQKASLATSAVAGISAGIGQLAALGLQFHLAEGSEVVHQEYPKALTDSLGNHVEATSSDHEAELVANGARLHPSLQAQPNQQSFDV